MKEPAIRADEVVCRHTRVVVIIDGRGLCGQCYLLCVRLMDEAVRGGEVNTKRYSARWNALRKG